MVYDGDGSKTGCDKERRSGLVSFYTCLLYVVGIGTLGILKDAFTS